jgi:hypothetical protein
MVPVRGQGEFRRPPCTTSTTGGRETGATETEAQLEAQLEAAILDLLAARASGASICPSEAARAVAAASCAGDAWRDLMPLSRRVAARLVAAGRIEMTQRGRVVAPAMARGPVRLRLPGEPG